MNNKRFCFILMPFLSELNYFYLFLKKHIEDNHSFKCFRADNNVLTIPILDKIVKYIQEADILIADCTNRNPNVFYEMGIAHTLNKKVILITKDNITETPSDIRHYEFIQYNLNEHEKFLERIDNAFNNAFIKDYEVLYEKALEIFNKFKIDNGLHLSPLSQNIFISKIKNVDINFEFDNSKNISMVNKTLLPKILDTSIDFNIMEKVTKWLLEN